MHLRPMLDVRDLRVSLDFYRSALGFELVECLGEPGHLFWAYLKKGTAELMLTEGGGPAFSDAASSPPNAGITLYFYPESVAELELLHADLTSRQAPVSALETTAYGHRLFTLRDPDGYTLSFGVLISAELCPGKG